MDSKMTIWFVCAGNICRSVVAEHAFRACARERNLPIETIRSAGLIAIPEDVPIADTMRAAYKAGLDLSTHRARRFAPRDIQPGALIFVMEREQQVAIQKLTGLSGDAVQLLGSFVPGTTDEIADPENETEAGFDACVARIVASVSTLADRIASKSIAV